MFDVLIIGGGLSGLINAILLTRGGLKTILIEKKQYPFHRVCGEYISKEVIPFLRSIDCMPSDPEPSDISKFVLTSVKGKELEMPLDLGGFGISRYELDAFLANEAKKSGAKINEKESVEDVDFLKEEDCFKVKTNIPHEYSAKIVIGSFGKRSNIDSKLNRPFFHKRSPYIGVKYHIKTDFDPNTIALHNFIGGYCGISKVENDTYNLCYLGSRERLRFHGSIDKMEEEDLNKNPHLKTIFDNSDFLFQRPVVINEFSFKKKEAVYDHILMSGDSAGLITPLCGNGMALAIHSAKVCSESILQFWNNGDLNRKSLEQLYSKKWNQLFSSRLWIGRQIQKLFGAVNLSDLSIAMGKSTPAVARFLMSKTHGSPF